MPRNITIQQGSSLIFNNKTELQITQIVQHQDTGNKVVYFDEFAPDGSHTNSGIMSFGYLKEAASEASEIKPVGPTYLEVCNALTELNIWLYENKLIS